MTTQRYIISVFGLDQPGIVGTVATLLGDSNCSIIDMNQTVVQGKFAMIMIVDATRSTQDMGYLRETFRTIGERLGVRIYIQREDIFQAMHRV
ncbi:MAG: ACT domain-containing protein [Acidobacteria bacterium]|nr:ACT domain-containing protein [Acidobacteriota bacterium]